MHRILAVDDDPAIRRIVAKTIESMGWRCHLCSDGLHALDALRCNRDFIAVVTDVDMPVMDGRQLVEAMRRDPGMPDIPAVIMSGVVGIREISDLLKKGATQFLPKPFSTEALRDAVFNCLDVNTGAMR